MCQCIGELEAREASKKKVEVRRKDDIPLQNRLVKLIGSKPLVDCRIGNLDTEVLLDSGSMISSADLEWVTENFPTAELRPISEFLEEDERGDVRFNTANNTEMPMAGCVVLQFSIGKYSFPVPFLVTSAKLSRPIIGSNVLKTFIEIADLKDAIELLINSIKNR